MTELLEQVITEVKKLPDKEQDIIARIILEELQDEARWDESFEKSQDVLTKMAEDAVAEDQAGKTQELDPDSL